MYWPHFMEQIRGRYYHHQKPPTKASHRPAGPEWPTDHPWPGTLLKASQEGPWCWQCPPGGCFTNTPQALQKYTHKKYKAGNHLYGESLKPKSRVRAQIMSLGTHTKFQHETLTRGMTSTLHKLTQTSRGHYESLVKHPWLVGVQCIHCPPRQPGECCLVACSSTKPQSPRGHGNQECN